MSIWLTEPSLEAINSFNKGSMIEYLDIKVTEIGDDYIKGTMPVDHRTVQSYGQLHGGASVVLAETIGSLASVLTVDFPKKKCVGLDINANHIGAVRSGLVTGTATPIHLGRSTQVWQIRIESDQGKLISVCRLTMAVLDSK